MFCNSRDWGHDCCVARSHVATVSRTRTRRRTVERNIPLETVGKYTRRKTVADKCWSWFSVFYLKRKLKRQMNLCKVSQDICKPNIIQRKRGVAKQKKLLRK